MVKDIYSRKLVINEVHESECTEHGPIACAGLLARQTANLPLVLHSDNGAAMKGSNMRAMMHTLGVSASFSRPRVSNDNDNVYADADADADALFRTAKYCAMWPKKPFDTLDEARQWEAKFVDWYMAG